jgi:hypothetical protein
MLAKHLLRFAVIVGLCAGLQTRLAAADWAQWLGAERDSVWRESGIVDQFPTNGLPIAWRVKVGAGYSAPAVADGRVYLTDRVAGSPQNQPKNPFMDRTSIPGVERVLCLDERTGTLLWQHEYDCPYNLSYPSGPRAMPQVSAGRVYTVGADGHLRCLDTKTGKLLWSRHYPTDFGAPTQTSLPDRLWRAHPDVGCGFNAVDLGRPDLLPRRWGRHVRHGFRQTHGQRTLAQAHDQGARLFVAHPHQCRRPRAVGGLGFPRTHCA